MISYNKLRHHVGHKVVCVGYGDGEITPFENVAVECETCGCVLVDADLEEE